MVGIDPGDQPLRVVIDDYLDTVAAAPRSVSAYRYDLDVGAELLDVVLGRPPVLADLSAPVLRELFVSYRACHGSGSTTRCWCSWNRFCLELARGGALPAGNPMSGVPRVSVERHEPMVLTAAQVEAVLQTLAATGTPVGRRWPIRDHALIALQLGCGLRPTELVGVDVDDLAPGGGQLTIHVRGSGPTQDRQVPVPDEAATLVEAYLLDRWARHRDPTPWRDSPWPAPAGTPLWIDDDGDRLSGRKIAFIVGRVLGTAGIEAPIRSGLHTMRLTCAARMLEQGTDPVQVASRLGYASLASLEALFPPPPSIQTLAASIRRTFAYPLGLPRPSTNDR